MEDKKHEETETEEKTKDAEEDNIDEEKEKLAFRH